MKNQGDSLEKMEAQLEQWNERIDELMMDAEHTEEEIRNRILSQIKSLRAKQEIVRLRFEKLKKSHQQERVLEYV
ncbi:MAG: hypothetical protein A2219_04230 [Elusimicrobia bacterium RIFOXYA2_FULL_50_26]|nr:MAG: hypothetical protein A2219_04230 [Elusimicrobia bacterium RIFOXYA2_FULL_50_26]OGS24983.1 MAG: hypothetical protein A2314_00250 [Elusimicrobia bacterium RIFOXYB2_FULL_50_12]